MKGVVQNNGYSTSAVGNVAMEEPRNRLNGIKPLFFMLLQRDLQIAAMCKNCVNFPVFQSMGNAFNFNFLSCFPFAGLRKNVEVP